MIDLNNITTELISQLGRACLLYILLHFLRTSTFIDYFQSDERYSKVLSAHIVMVFLQSSPWIYLAFAPPMLVV